jgi:hypothetical protein
MRRTIAPASVALAIVCLASATGCIGSSGDGSAPGLQVDCTGLTCDWITVQGTPIYGSTWHDGDLGVDLSNDGKIVILLRDVLFATQNVRQLNLKAVLVRAPTAQLSLQLDFYAPGQALGATFWDRQPVLLVTRTLDVVELGVVQFHRPVLVPSEGAAVVIRVVKDGTGYVMLDELTLG